MYSKQYCLHKTALPQFRQIGLNETMALSCAQAWCEAVTYGGSTRHSTQTTSSETKQSARKFLANNAWVKDHIVLTKMAGTPSKRR